MIKNKKILCLIPARGGSKGLPKKNITELQGKPLLGWPIQAAKKSEYVDKIIVSTENEEIAFIAREQGAEVPFMRPMIFASDTSSSFDVIKHAVETLAEKDENYDYLLLLEPTSPLTDTHDIDLAIETLDNKREVADAIVGVSKVEACHPSFLVKINEQGLIRSYIERKTIEVIRRQDIEELYFFEGSLYLSDVDVLIDKKTFYHERTLPYIVPRWKSCEIDEFQDLICVDAIMRHKERLLNDDKGRR